MTSSKRHVVLAFTAALAFVAGHSVLAQIAPSNPGAQASTSHIARISGGVMAGNILNKVPPVYPQDAKDAKVSGTVVLRAIIGKDGTVENLTVISGPDMLRASALDAVRQWTYKPYLLNGNPVEVDTTITINFNLGS